MSFALYRIAAGFSGPACSCSAHRWQFLLVVGLHVIPAQAVAKGCRIYTQLVT